MPSDENTVNGDDGRHAEDQAADELRLARTIMDVAREMKRTVPAPRAAPYFGLDSDVGYDLAVLDSLSSRGIFRKYELVLLLRSGFGGTARWLSRRLGCRILGVDPDVGRARAARRLNDGSRMAEDVSFAASSYDELPFRERVFTHVWMIDPTARERSPQALREAFRVLRSGAHFAMQIAVEGTREVNTIQEDLAQVGFVDFSSQSAMMMPRGQAASSARARLRASLPLGDVLPASTGGDLLHPRACRQIFCRRP
jgi:SAM-dependent methyltransferase